MHDFPAVLRRVCNVLFVLCMIAIYPSPFPLPLTQQRSVRGCYSAEPSHNILVVKLTSMGETSIFYDQHRPLHENFYWAME